MASSLALVPTSLIGLAAAPRSRFGAARLRTPLGVVLESASDELCSEVYELFLVDQTIEEFLDDEEGLDLLAHGLRAAGRHELIALVWKFLGASAAPTTQSQAPASREALSAWAQLNGVPHALVFSAYGLVPRWAHLSYDGTGPSVADVFDRNFKSHYAEPGALRGAVWKWLEEYAAELNRYRRSPKAPPTAEPPFRTFLARLEAWRTPVLSWFPRLDQPSFSSRIELGDEGVVVYLSFAEQQPRGLIHPRVHFPYEPHLVPRCTCPIVNCWHGSAAVDALAWWLSTSSPHLRERLAEHLRPGHEKLFAALDAAPRRPSPVAELNQVGFRVDLQKLFTVQGSRAIEVLVDFGKAKGKPKVIKAREALAASALLPARDVRSLERVAELQRDRSGEQVVRAQLLRGLVSQPNVVLRENRKDVAVTVRTAPIQLEVLERPDGVEVELRLNGAPLVAATWLHDEAGALAVDPRLAPGQLWLGELPPSAWTFVRALQKYGGRFPRGSGPQLMKALEGLGPVPLNLPPSLSGTKLAADERLRLRVLPGNGLCLALQLTVEPLPGEAAWLPGEGPVELSSWRDSGRVYTTRDLNAERAAAAALATTLALPAQSDGSASLWQLDEPEVVLGVLERLPHLGPGVMIQTDSALRKVTRPLDSKDLKLSVRQRSDWFALEGAARVDGLVVPLAKVLEAIRGGVRWVDLGNHQIARLSQRLVEQLAPVALSAAPRGDSTEVTLADAPALDALEGQVEALEVAAGFDRILKRMREARTLKVKLPKGFKGVLRDYQLDGYVWLSRLAAWGAGAVLADDMGLGKTVQTLALLLSRSKLGPALVVAPTSVAPNWKLEATRFAPELKVTLLRDVGRAEAIEAAGPGDVLIVSWGLLVQEQALLEQKQFQTLVLDEAQALKNAATQRAQAARAIKADFVVALSGTPIENHLGELWSLFRAVLPGLFGSQEIFRSRFALPIERNDDPIARAALKSLVQPFLLRRAKGTVAKELPARTDIRLDVPLTPLEQGVYEAARQEAVKQLTSLADPGAPESRFHVLAALTRLRQLACHVGLVDETWEGGSGKVSRLNELLCELKESGHKVLVFSQFTSLLDRVELSFTGQSLRWLRLDGSTSDAERQRRVAAFQEGSTDVFLLSLKAGGTGLNLTAADYVVHLDPWWNPAVEDQASDRAHRLGQTRPVTVYRLVSQGTVEERILALHASKRALVAGVLEGSHTAGGLTTKQLIALVTGDDRAGG